MIERIKKQGILSPRRVFARSLARQAGLKVMSPDNPHEIARTRMDANGDKVPPPASVDIQAETFADRPALRFKPRNARPGRFLFLHGGGYCLGSPQSHKLIAARISRTLSLEMVSLDYRLAPEHPFPAAVDDGAVALKALQAETDGPVFIGGDSAGGGLSLATLLRHRSEGHAMPQGVYLMSPWVDLSASGESTRTKAGRDPMLKPHYLNAGAAHYMGDTDPETPEASPLFADLSGLPPIFIQTGEEEILRDDTTRLTAALKAANVEVTCELWDALWHDFQMFAPILPEADQALERLAAWAIPRLDALSS